MVSGPSATGPNAAGHAVQWATDAEISQVVSTWLRPAYLIALFLLGWAFDVRIFNDQKIDYATVLGLNREELRHPHYWLCAALSLVGTIAAAQYVILRHATTPDVLWAPVVVYMLIFMVLCVPFPRALERRLGAWRRPLRRTLWRCFFPAWRETAFLEVIVADGLTSLAKSFFDLGLSTCVACRTSGSPWGLVASLFTASLDPRASGSDMLSKGVLSESGPPMAASYGIARLQAGKSLQKAIEECSRSPTPYILWTVPAAIRARQCIMSARFATSDQARSQHYANLAKYMSVMPVILCSLCLARAGPDSSPFGLDDFETLWALSSLGNAFFSATWDLVFDWGLLQPLPCFGKAPMNMGLRPVLLLRPSIPLYHGAIALNLLGRTLWSLRWSQQCAALGPFVCNTVQQSSEVVRRCLWNVLRVEWEVIKRDLYSSRRHEPVPV